MSQFKTGDRVTVVGDQFTGDYGLYYRGDTGVVQRIITRYSDSKQFALVRFEKTQGEGSSTGWWVPFDNLELEGQYDGLTPVQRKIKLMWERQNYVKLRGAQVMPQLW